MERSIRAAVGLAGLRKPIERGVQQADALVRILVQQSCDAVELGSDETGAAIESLDAESRRARRVVERVTGFRIGVEGDIGDIAAGIKRRQLVKQSRRYAEVLRSIGRGVKGLAWLAELGSKNVPLILRQRKNDADTTPAAWKNSARDRVGSAERFAKAFEIVPAPHSLMRNGDVVIGWGVLSVEAVLLKAGQRGAGL